MLEITGKSERPQGDLNPCCRREKPRPNRPDQRKPAQLVEITPNRSDAEPSHTLQGRPPSATRARPFVTNESQGPGRNLALLTVREVAAALRLSTATVYGLCRLGELPCIRTSTNTIRIREDDLAAYLRK